MYQYFQYYIILRDYLHEKLRFKKEYGVLYTFVLSAARLLVPVSMIVSIILMGICLVYGFATLATLFAITVIGIGYGIQKEKVWMNELLLVIGIPMTVLNGFVAFIRALLYNRTIQPSGDLSTIILTLVLATVGIVIVMTANSGNFKKEITNPNLSYNTITRKTKRYDI